MASPIAATRSAGLLVFQSIRKLVSVFEAALTCHGLVGSSQHVVELTETAMMDNINQAKLPLDALKELGAGIAIDDYGTPYSTLTYFRKLPVGIIKIDQSFVAGIEHDRWNERICASPIDLAHDLGMAVVGEGLETQRQHAALRELGCVMTQAVGMADPPRQMNSKRVSPTSAEELDVLHHGN